MSRLLICLVACYVVSSALAQYPRRPSMRGETKSMSGEITQVAGNRVMWEADGNSGPIPFDRTTRWEVKGTGDAGFLSVGSVVTVKGIFKAEDSKIILASFDVHRSPRDTARPGNCTVQTADPNITVKGTVISAEPMAIKAIDTITLIKGSDANGQRSRPVSGATLKVEPRGGKVETVGLILGSAPQLIAPGDSVTVTVNSLRPTVAQSISVTKSEPLSSKRGEGGKAKEDEKKPAADEGGAKPEEGKSAAEGEKEAGAKEGGEKMETEKAEGGAAAES